jgi:hypothetical protein
MQASDPLNPRAVLGAVKAQPRNAGARRKPSATAGLDVQSIWNRNLGSGLSYREVVELFARP